MAYAFAVATILFFIQWRVFKMKMIRIKAITLIDKINSKNNPACYISYHTVFNKPFCTMFFSITKYKIDHFFPKLVQLAREKGIYV
jgi:hypothetical protein